LAIVVAGTWWLFWQWTHVVVSDARVAADMVSLSSRVAGWVEEVAVIEGDEAGKGWLLVRVDRRDVRLQIQELAARLAGIAARRSELAARLQLVDRQTRSHSATQKSRIKAARAAVAAAVAESRLASTENDRSEDLSEIGAVPRQQRDRTRTTLESARQKERSARAELQAAEAALEEAAADREKLEVLKRQAAELGPRERELQARRERAVLELQDRTIRMPFPGVVDRVFVQTGEYVTAGQRLLLVHDPRRVRIEARVKETSIRYFTPGKKVTVTVDALPGRDFTGVVDRVGQAATSEFALLPSPNPSGNFTKITQRLPVRITISQVQDRLKPGMMAEVEASARD